MGQGDRVERAKFLHGCLRSAASQVRAASACATFSRQAYPLARAQARDQVKLGIRVQGTVQLSGSAAVCPAHGDLHQQHSHQDAVQPILGQLNPLKEDTGGALMRAPASKTRDPQRYSIVQHAAALSRKEWETILSSLLLARWAGGGPKGAGRHRGDQCRERKPKTDHKPTFFMGPIQGRAFFELQKGMPASWGSYAKR